MRDMTDHSPFAERRNVNRHSVYARGRARRVGGTRRDVFEVTTWNVSHDGIQVQVPPDVGAWLETGDRLQLAFGPEDPARVIDLTGQVAWREPWAPEHALPAARPELPPDRYRVGIKVEGPAPGLIDRFFGR